MLSIAKARADYLSKPMCAICGKRAPLEKMCCAGQHNVCADCCPNAGCAHRFNVRLIPLGKRHEIR